MIQPDGNTPTEADLTTHRYHHHTAIGAAYGKIFIAYSSGGTNEDAGGQMTVISASADDGDTWGAPTLVVPLQSTFSGTGASYVNGTRISYPRCFVTNDSAELYIVASIDQVSTPASSTGFIGKALVARKVNSDGTLGTLYRISEADYDPLSGISAIPYDSTLSASLLPKAKLYGIWGGSAPGKTASTWLGWISQSGNSYAEPTTVDLGDGVMLRLWRSITTDTNHVYQGYSYDGGTRFDPLRATTLPNSPSSLYAFSMPDKSIALIGNPVDNGTLRDPLYLATFSRTTGKLKAVSAIRQGVSDVPVYPGDGKGGGASYPGAVVVGTNLHVSYSLQKESVGHTRIPLSSIP